MASPLLLAALAASGVLSPDSCRCGGAPAELEFNQSPAVFVGEVLPSGVDSVDAPHDPPGLWARVRVLRSWKGAAPDSILLVHSTAGARCEYRLSPGSVHLLYTWLAKPPKVSACSRSRPIAAAAELLDHLGPAIGESADQLEVVATWADGGSLGGAQVTILGAGRTRIADAEGRAVFNRMPPGSTVVRVADSKGYSFGVDSVLIVRGRPAALLVKVRSRLRPIPVDSLRRMIPELRKFDRDAKPPVPSMHRGGRDTSRSR